MPRCPHALRFLLLPLLLLPTTAGRSAGADVVLTERTTVRFADVEQGRRILGAPDEYVSRLSPFDLASRTGREGNLTGEDYLDHVVRCVQPWTEEERRRIGPLLFDLQQRMNVLANGLPETVYLIKTDGRDEANAAYTRHNAVVLPPRMIAQPDMTLKRLFAHEMFHILSRHNPLLREKLYETIGFLRCGQIVLPDELARRHITNPDAPTEEHYINVDHQGLSVAVVPILFSSEPTYDTRTRLSFFRYLQLRLLAITPVERPDGTRIWKPMFRDADDQTRDWPVLHEIREVTGFFEQIGKNTTYTFHPEEVMADNFAMLALGLDRKLVQSPEVLDRIEKVLLAAAPPAIPPPVTEGPLGPVRPVAPPVVPQPVPPPPVHSTSGVREQARS